MNKEIFCNRLIEAMNKKGMKKIELADMTGISRGQISQYFSGKFVPKQTNLDKIARALGVSVDYLIGYDIALSEKNAKKTFSLTPMDKELLECFHLLDDATKAFIMDTVRMHAAKAQEKSDNGNMSVKAI